MTSSGAAELGSAQDAVCALLPKVTPENTPVSPSNSSTVSDELSVPALEEVLLPPELEELLLELTKEELVVVELVVEELVVLELVVEELELLDDELVVEEVEVVELELEVLLELVEELLDDPSPPRNTSLLSAWMRIPLPAATPANALLL